MDNLKEFKAAKAELEDTVKSCLNSFSAIWGVSVASVDVTNFTPIGFKRSDVAAVSVKVEI